MSRRSSSYPLLVLAMLLWAGNYVLARAIHADIPPVSLSFWRWAVAGVILLAITAHAVPAHAATLRRHWRLLAGLAASGVVFFTVGLYMGLNTTTVINATLVSSLSPVFIAVISFVLTRHAIPPRQMAGIAASLAGAVVIISRADAAALAALEINSGDLWVLAATVSWAIYSVLLRRLPASLPPTVMLSATAVLGVAMLAPLYAWEVAAVGGFEATWANAASIGYLALFVSVIGIVFYNRAVADVGAIRAGLFIHLIPVFAVILALVLLGERLRPFHLAGAVFIAFGIYLTVTAPSTAPRVED
ncbi:MAG: DMT family transporter [Rhodospirillales bacterium]|nr:DMT family transporter [Rhodospirillales bacterium]